MGRFNSALCCGLAFVSISSQAALQAKDVTIASKSADTLRLNYILEMADLPATTGIPRNKSLTVPVTQPSYVNRITGTISRRIPATYAVLTAVDAVGWAIDELTGQITRVGDPAPDPDYNSRYYYTDSRTYSVAGQLPNVGFAQTVLDYVCPMYGWSNCVARSVNQTNTNNWQISYNRSGTTSLKLENILRWDCTSKYNSICDVPAPVVEGQQENVPESEYVDAILPSLWALPTSQQVQPYKNDFGEPLMTQDLDNAIDDWLSDMASRSPDWSYDPTNNTISITDPETGLTTQERLFPDAAPEAASENYTESDSTTIVNNNTTNVEFPIFCEWAPNVCEFLDWFKTEPDLAEPTELPMEDIYADDFRVDFDSGLGSGSCPAPVAFSYGQFTGEYSYSTACMAATTYIKPVLLTIASLLAAFIIVGASRRAV
jgi:hypothetical protein